MAKARGTQRRRFQWTDIYESLNTKHDLDAFGIIQDGMVVKICAHTRTDKKSFQHFCEELADAQGYCLAKRTAA